MINKVTRIRDVAEIRVLDCHLSARGTGTKQIRLLSARVLIRAHSRRVCVPRCDDNVQDRVILCSSDVVFERVGFGSWESVVNL
jgi:hypothetical protein